MAGTLKAMEKMHMTIPDWLAQRGGDLKLGSDGHTWYFIVGSQPQYSLVAVPVGGRFGCTIRQTINGKRIESAGINASADDAIRAGLEDLRKALGWG
jgi:hypothetical protein